MSRAALGCLVVVRALVTSDVARAWEFTPDADGDPVRWETGEVAIALAPRAGDAASEALDVAIHAWSKACEGRLDRVRVDDPAAAALVVTWTEPWPYRAGYLALTAVEHVSGDIRTATIELNASLLRDQGPPYDLPSVVTHELGHALGMAHELTIDEAVMAPTLRPRTVRRELHDDDIEGIQTLYPVDPAAPLYCASQAGPGARWIGLVAAAAVALRRRRPSHPACSP